MPICQPCKDAADGTLFSRGHEYCPGGTHCCCQHRDRINPPVAEEINSVDTV